ncbi:hypothetical protein ACI2KT_18870 [Ensifer adhaerens]|uniref:hypothetical protein n=1 Tax=Ensifer adhaerens TaxID=106592 RepID=UPI00384A504B
MDEVKDLIERLFRTELPSRALDTEVAKALGWKEEADGVWVNTQGGRSPRAPFYTSSLHAIYTFASSLSPRGGASWENGVASAQIGDGRLIQAKTPEIAMCIAAILAVHSKGD